MSEMSEITSNSDQKTIPPVEVDIEFWGIRKGEYGIFLSDLREYTTTPSDPDLSELKWVIQSSSKEIDCRFKDDKIICTANAPAERFVTDQNGQVTFQSEGVSMHDIRLMNQRGISYTHHLTVTLSELPCPKPPVYLKSFIQSNATSCISLLPTIQVSLTYAKIHNYMNSRPFIRCVQISEDSRYQDVQDQYYQQRLEDLSTNFLNKEIQFVPDPNDGQQFYVSCLDYEEFDQKEASENSPWYKMSLNSVDKFIFKTIGRTTRSVEFGVLTKDEDNSRA